MSDIAVSVRGLCKEYTIAHQAKAKHSTLAESLLHKIRSPLTSFRTSTETFHALRDVSFDIKKGEIVGIIGRNGAGKSTLLKILSRITEPTAGEIDLYGRVGSLLEVGTGFHPELTGRENIFLNGAILGMSKREIQREFDAIVEFAGIEKFLDTPVKRFSSGMYVRLAFAVAAHLSCEIVILDEVLAVGDGEFQRKCLGKIRDVAKSGRTALLVSHNIATISSLCDSCMILDAGQLAYHGDTASATKRYEDLSKHRVKSEEAALVRMRPAWARPLIFQVKLLGCDGSERHSFNLGEGISIEVTFDVGDDPRLVRPILGVVINSDLVGKVAAINTRMTGINYEASNYTRATMKCHLDALPFVQGDYTIDVWLGDGPSDLDVLLGCITFEIQATDIYGTGHPPLPDMGFVFLNATFELTSEPSTATTTDNSKHNDEY